LSHKKLWEIKRKILKSATVVVTDGVTTFASTNRVRVSSHTHPLRTFQSAHDLKIADFDSLSPFSYSGAPNSLVKIRQNLTKFSTGQKFALIMKTNNFWLLTEISTLQIVWLNMLFHA
jgi:hypothetical protein